MLEEWQTFSHDSLRLLPARVASWTTALARIRARLPMIVTFSVKGVGDIEIRPDQVFFPEGGTYPDLDGMDWFPLEQDSQRGWVGVDRRLALTLVRAVLGGPDPLTIRSIGRAERGIMAAILLSALDRLKVSQAVHLGLGPLESVAVLFYSCPPDGWQKHLVRSWDTWKGWRSTRPWSWPEPICQALP
jgi:hypothetical protein